jgi:hypothetical protein
MFIKIALGVISISVGQRHVINGQVQANLACWSASELGVRLYKSLLVIYANFSYIISMTVELLTLNHS